VTWLNSDDCYTEEHCIRWQTILVKEILLYFMEDLFYLDKEERSR